MRTLLVADESITVQRVITLTFAEQEISVVSVPDGRQAMEKMAAQRPDIVLAGTTLPHVSGYELARFMRGRADLQDVPVLLLSGAFEMVDQAQLSQSGANGVLEKPVEPTVVIGRVKELLGLKSDDKPAAPAGRLITPAQAPREKTAAPSAPPHVAASAHDAPAKSQPVRTETSTKPVEQPSAKDGDYLDTLDAAFDSLDRQISGRPAAKTPRNPSGPLGPSASGGDPRSPAPKTQTVAPGNPVYEVDDDWFGEADRQSHDAATAGGHEIAADLRDPGLLPAAAATPQAPVYEVDDEWFAEDDKLRAARASEQKQLAAEMGIHDVDLPELPAGLTPAPPPGLEAEPIPDGVKLAAAIESAASLANPPAAAYVHSSGAPLPEIKIVTPEITPSMLDDIAARVAERLTASAFGDQLRESLAAVMRETVARTVGETVRPVVSETSERVVREVVAQAAERAVRDVVSQTTERVVREVVPETAERTVREVVAHSVERAIPDAVSQTTERVVREVVPQSAERVVREVVAEIVERAVPEAVSQSVARTVPDAVSQTTERVVREITSQSTERVVREVVAESVERAVPEAVSRSVERAVPEVVAQTTERVVRETVLETSERLVRAEIERIKSRTNTSS